MKPPDYDLLLDAGIRAFIAETAALYPDDTATREIAAQRVIYDAMCAHFRAPRPPGLSVEDRRVAGVPVRVYAPERAGRGLLLYLHGGGFVVGGLDSHDDICAEIAAETGCALVAADYRLAPEHRHPAAFEDALSVFEALAGEGAPVVLIGDSAGACLAAAISHATRGAARAPAAQVLIYPGLGGDPDAGSALEHASAPMLSRDDVLFYAGIRGEDPADPTARPLAATDYSGLPPTVLSSAECDPLADDAAAYASQLEAAGVAVAHVAEPGLVHGWLRARHRATRAREAYGRILAAVRSFTTV